MRRGVYEYVLVVVTTCLLCTEAYPVRRDAGETHQLSERSHSIRYESAAPEQLSRMEIVNRLESQGIDAVSKGWPDAEYADAYREDGMVERWPSTPTQNFGELLSLQSYSVYGFTFTFQLLSLRFYNSGGGS